MNKIKIIIISVFLAILCSHIKSAVKLEKNTEMRYLPIDKEITTGILQRLIFLNILLGVLFEVYIKKIIKIWFNYFIQVIVIFVGQG